MPLMRGYTELDDKGKIAIPSNIRRQLGLYPGRSVGIVVVRVKGTGRKPHLIIHNPNYPPYISALEAVFTQGASEVDEEGKIFLTEDIRSEAKVEPGYHLELKVQGACRTPWIAIHIRGPKRLTTLQQKVRAIKPKKGWRIMPLEY